MNKGKERILGIYFAQSNMRSQSIIIIIIITIIHFMYMNVPSQQPDGQLQKQHNIQT